ncbi:MAG: hypothetical protein SOY12_05075 [Schaedlerella sp.]|nr:hypothetical protein [Lachnospiraceae bacterium]MDY4202408.1 hypothetical protein [Schaedlerella sp.]
MNKYLKAILCLVVIAVCIVLVVVGQKTVGIPYLLMELAGLAGLLVMLYLYNKKYQ